MDDANRGATQAERDCPADGESAEGSTDERGLGMGFIPFLAEAWRPRRVVPVMGFYALAALVALLFCDAPVGDNLEGLLFRLGEGMFFWLLWYVLTRLSLGGVPARSVQVPFFTSVLFVIGCVSAWFLSMAAMVVLVSERTICSLGAVGTAASYPLGLYFGMASAVLAWRQGTRMPVSWVVALKRGGNRSPAKTPG